MPERFRPERIKAPEPSEPVARGVRPGERAGNPAIDAFNDAESKKRKAEKLARTVEEEKELRRIILRASLGTQRITKKEFDKKMRELEEE